ncbi:mitochondrial inner-membrane-bound regulator-domain-containing protein [Pseudoneurospora amorphoporcata]|uniref:Mitochondrial inner-membrane-bound regulator-domain-containing protein n=1 Tax=Pseudoneurospora amorphoporcata TaxID=241081 RepID=A0AAN6SIT1_9PEZI|nr:mitochondrial inner-membrane-bound regulator-domain-containing protein [Pseudoneurospora amorphoporcata]
MLSRKVGGSFVCLRCRLQLAGAATTLTTRRPLPFTPPPATLTAAVTPSHATLFANRRLYTSDQADAADTSRQLSEGADVPDESNRKQDLFNPEPFNGKVDLGRADPADITKQIIQGFDAVDNEIQSNRAREEEAAAPDTENDIEDGDKPTVPNIIRYSPADRRERKQETWVRHKGQRMAVKEEDLTVGMLGKPSQVVVLRSRGKLSKRQTAHVTPATVHTAVDDLEESLEKQSLDPIAEEVLENIHELRPEDSVLTGRQFAELLETLYTSFTSRQLEQYLMHHAEAQKVLSKPLEADPPWIVKRYPWIPAVEGAMTSFDYKHPMLRGYYRSDTRPKQKLALRIMLECWELASYDIIDGQGHLVVSLRDTEFSLLMLGSKRWLADISRNTLIAGQKIELIPASNAICINAPKAMSELVLSEVNRVLEHAKTISLDLSLVTKQAKNPAVLKSVGDVTHSVVRLDPAGDKINVTWVDMPARNENLENMADIVLRFLLVAFGQKPRTEHTILVLPPHARESGRYLIEPNCQPKLPWQERIKLWARWVAAVPKAGPSSTGVKIPADVLPHPLNLAKEAPRHQLIKASFPDLHRHQSAEGWSEAPETDTRAIFGHVLHAPAKSPDSAQAQRSRIVGSASTSGFPSRLDTSLSRTFMPVLPPISELKFANNLKTRGLYHSDIVMRFVPAPEQPGSAEATSAPDLELVLEADSREVKGFTSLRAITESFTGDIICPSSPIDVRLKQRRQFTMDVKGIGECEPIVDFVNKSVLRPWDGKLKTPPSIEALPLPKRLLSGPSVKKIEEEIVPVKYLFAGMEIHRRVAADYKGFTATYRSIEAGQRGGKYAELSVDAVRAEVTRASGPKYIQELRQEGPLPPVTGETARLDPTAVPGGSATITPLNGRMSEGYLKPAEAEFRRFLESDEEPLVRQPPSAAAKEAADELNSLDLEDIGDRDPDAPGKQEFKSALEEEIKKDEWLDELPPLQRKEGEESVVDDSDPWDGNDPKHLKAFLDVVEDIVSGRAPPAWQGR